MEPEPDRRRVIFVALAIIVVVGIGWAYYANKKANQAKTAVKPTATVVSNLTNLDPTDFDSAVKSEYALAISKASADYKIATIEVNIDKNMAVDSINTRYIFSSPSDMINNWMITVAATTQNYIRALVPKDDYAGDIAPFDTGLWKYNYVTALQLAEKAGGLDWRNQNTLSGVKLTLKISGANSILTWTVEYDSQGQNKTVVLDATSGKVVE